MRRAAFAPYTQTVVKIGAFQPFEQLEREVLALVIERHLKHNKIDWQFSIQSARSKLNSHYLTRPLA